jgi:hypothetical protein
VNSRSRYNRCSSTIRDKGIRALPVLVFNVPAATRVGGPFRDRPSAGKDPYAAGVKPANVIAAHRFIRPQQSLRRYVINGSMDAQTFFELFAQIRNDTLQASL